MTESVSEPETTAVDPAVRARALLLERAATVAGGLPDVPSPCVSVCRMNAERSFCEGCFRSIDEIRAWSRSDDAHKRTVWARLLKRMDATTPP
ncbi:DUF1289 domain-containing protein [Xylophilus ampelinus]|uniref:Fe-S protein YdhL (DUF1289 family) n=1 Tax=Xylophilus ampelinus TaxID=54067 RepID=A0A318SGJ9_9BURK|nr:DUF1289 domain-containing protein [Xylophilus ampelinus]MCS4510964.1 DUF1289 domain-containing protein [Xylophilus ampelinus]PYE76130.1 hypothetical protein DFQ15_11691 [Xylophilus ampelinus]